MTDATIRITDREYSLVPRARGDAPQRGWARALIDDPTQQHLVHLFAGRYLEHQPGRDHRELMAELEIELSMRFVAVADDVELARVA